MATLRCHMANMSANDHGDNASTDGILKETLIEAKLKIGKQKLKI